MIKFVYISVLLYVLFYDLKLTRYADQTAKKIIRDMIYGLILLITSLYLRTDPLGTRSSTYIALVYGLSPILTVVSAALLLRVILKYREELTGTIRQLIKNKWNLLETAILNALLIATAVDTSLWTFMGTFAVLGALIVREAFIVALKRNNEAGHNNAFNQTRNKHTLFFISGLSARWLKQTRRLSCVKPGESPD